MIFDFVEEKELSLDNNSSNNNNRNSSSGDSFRDVTTDDEIDEITTVPEAENRLFWESQEQLLTEYLFRSSRMEAKIRQVTKEIVEEMKSGRRVDGYLKNSLQREICHRLQQAGYNSGICKAKWMNMKQVPAGEHTYIEVLDINNPKKEVTRVIIELNFRTEFEMAKGSREYNHLINQLPEIYVGKAKRLELLIKILCAASKRCMRDQKMHIAPWRKLKYMQAKWQGVREESVNLFSVVDHSKRMSRPMVSLLTFDLVESF